MDQVAMEMRDQHGDVFVFAGCDTNGEPTYARTGRHGITPEQVRTYRHLYPNRSAYMSIQLWASRGRYLYPVDHPTVAPQDALLARIQDLLLRSPGCTAEAVRMLTDLQSAVHDLDQHLLDGGALPSRWTH